MGDVGVVNGMREDLSALHVKISNASPTPDRVYGMTCNNSLFMSDNVQ